MVEPAAAWNVFAKDGCGRYFFVFVRHSVLPLLVQAALAGQGILLAWGNVIDNIISSGALVPIIPGFTQANQSYYLVTNRRRAVREEARVFKQWILQATARLRD
ncbi:hypothetical protein [Phyllobacterium zundukense]|uniref:Uncharacterized protein n=1 Tax=Phyllobacterium zundukense TaxID=1867719 RepID=A0ACD4CUZ8_9HYPH|nr:hypothetical protein [Phyllobacterium zundukense]UXN57405.1 hypothetical protein N8E88_03350 [Phyllobacterium zundukense]